MRNTTNFRTTEGRRWQRWLGLSIVGIGCVLPVFAQTKAPNEAPAPETPSVFAVDPGYKYDPKGRLDPFVSPVPPRPPSAAAPARGAAPGAQPTSPPPPPEVIVPISRPRGLKGLLLEDISVKGIVVASDPMMTKAIIQGPGNRTYNVSRGEKVFNAVVKDIRMDGIVFSPIIQRDGSGAPLTLKEVRSDSVIYTKLPNNVRTEPSTRDIVRKLHPAAGEPK